MSEQIQSLLNEMEDKFQKSFSQSILDEPLNNPESARKPQSKHGDIKILEDLHHEEMPILQNLSQQNRTLNDNHQRSIQWNQMDIVHEEQDGQNRSKQIDENDLRKMNLLDLKTSHIYEDYHAQNYRKNSSEQQFSKMSKETNSPQNQNPFYYKQLTMKLQKALQKISTEKSIPQMKKSHSFYDRIQQFQAKKKRQIERKKQQLEQKQISSIKGKPLINSHSRMIVSQISNDPIYVRCDKIIEKKKQKEKQYTKIKQERQEKEYLKFKEQYDTHMNELKHKYQNKTIRSPEEYYDQMMNWCKHKQRNIQSKTIQLNEKLLNQNTFKPLINSKSQKIINKKNEKRVPIYEREPKPKEQLSDPNCTFKPKINKTNFYKKMSYYQSQI